MALATGLIWKLLAMLPATIVKALDVKFGKLKNLKVFGDGSQKRDYTFSYDLRDIIMWFIKNYSSSKVTFFLYK